MKRTKTVIGSDGDTTVEINIKITSRSGLTRHEAERQMEVLASAVMLQVPCTPFAGLTLSKVRAG